MKKILFGTIVSSLCISMFCQYDANNMLHNENVNRSYSLKKQVKQSMAIPDDTVTCDSVRFLSELNESMKAEAYPWISGDGLRLYYSKSSDTTSDRIYFAERESLISPFSNIHPLIDIESFSGWLTPDELNIYFINRNAIGQLSNTLYHASRNIKEGAFGEAETVQLMGNISGFVSGPSLTPNGNQLFICNNSGSIIPYRILILNKTGDNEFTLADSLNIPVGYIPSPGQLSADGLEYYLSMKYQNKKLLYFYARNSLSEKFVNVYMIKNETINDTTYNNLQPSVSNSGNCMFFTRATADSWEHNDLYLAYNMEVTFRHTAVNFTEYYCTLNIYPNPAANYVIIDFSVIKDYVWGNVRLYNSTGMMIENLKIDKGMNIIKISVLNYAPGIYYFTLTTKEGNIHTGKFIVNSH